MPEPPDKDKVSVFLHPSDKRKFKKLCAEGDIPMCGRLEAWVLFDNAYFEEYGRVFSIEEHIKMYFGKEE
jgi:hypothetical protein